MDPLKLAKDEIMCHQTNETEVPCDLEGLTDIEIALYLLKMLDYQAEFSLKQNPLDRGDLICGMVDNAIQNMSNPFAKKLLVDKMTEH